MRQDTPFCRILRSSPMLESQVRSPDFPTLPRPSPTVPETFGRRRRVVHDGAGSLPARDARPRACALGEGFLAHRYSAARSSSEEAHHFHPGRGEATGHDQADGCKEHRTPGEVGNRPRDDRSEARPNLPIRSVPRATAFGTRTDSPGEAVLISSFRGVCAAAVYRLREYRIFRPMSARNG